MNLDYNLTYKYFYSVGSPFYRQFPFELLNKTENITFYDVKTIWLRNENIIFGDF